MTTLENRPKLWSKNFILLMLINLTQSAGFNMLQPTMPKCALSIGASLAEAGIISGVFAITALVARPFGGAAADRINKKSIILITNAIMGLSVLSYSFTGSTAPLLAIRIIHGAAFAVNNTANNAWAAEFIPGTRIGEGIGYLGMSYILAIAVGPGLGLSISENYSYSAMFMLSLTMILCATVLVLMIKQTPDEKKTIENRGKLRIKDLIAREGLIFLFLMALTSVLSGQLNSFVALIGDERGIRNISLYFTVSALTTLINRPLFGKFTDKFKLSYLLYPCFLLAMIASVIIASAATLKLILIAAVLAAFGTSSLTPAIQASCIKKLGVGRTGLAASMYMMGADIGQGIGPAMGGAISDAYGYPAMLYVTAALQPVGMLVYFLYIKRTDKRNGKTAQA